METQGISKVYSFGEFEIDEARITLTAAGDPVAVQRRVWDLLLYLVKNRDRVVDKDELQDAVWPGMVITETALTRAVMKARRAVADDATSPRWIKTVHGRGYHFVGTVHERSPPEGQSSVGLGAEGELSPATIPTSAVAAADASSATPVTAPGEGADHGARRRRLFRNLTAYGAFAWLFNQGAAVVWEAFEWDRTGQQALLVATIVGGLLLAFVSWFFVFTPSGLKRPDELARAPGGTLIHQGTIVVLLLALATSLYWNFRSVDAPRAAAEQISVAVLPFRNLSGDASFSYFSDGVAVGLLEGLSRLTGVRVVGRTSSFRFRDGDDGPATIAAALAARHLFEGSVQRAGGRVRVEVALLAASGERLWSERFDFADTELFELQDALSAAAVTALAQRAPGVDPQRADAARRGRALRGTDSLDAYDHLLRAREQVVLRTRDSLQAAVTEFEAAIGIDPQYARAWSGLAWTRFSLANFGVGERAAGMSAARDAARRAAGFDPMLADPHRVLAELHSRYELRFDKAAEAISLARELSDDVNIIGTQAGIVSKLGRHDEAADLALDAFRRDPLNAGLAASVTIRMLRAERLDEAEQSLAELLALRPEHGDRHWLRAQLALARGDFEAARTAIAEDELEYLRLSVGSIALHGLGRDDESRAQLDRLIETDAEGAAFQIAEVHAARGENAAALDWLERAYAQRDPGVSEVLSTPSLKGLYAEPRFATFIGRLGLSIPTDGAR
ncbi:MAG: winged helix-turn-helix domain-containing protein [Pseudomonadota bacterium]